MDVPGKKLFSCFPSPSLCKTYCNNRAVTGAVLVVRMTPGGGGKGNSQ